MAPMAAFSFGIPLYPGKPASSVTKITRIDVYGNPSEELQKAIRGHNAQSMQFFCWVQSSIIGIKRFFPSQSGKEDFIKTHLMYHGPIFYQKEILSPCCQC